MFYLSLIEHTLRLPPHLLDLPLDEAIKGELEKLFVDKVISKLGLCTSVYDIKSIEGGFILPGDGASTYTVVFRLVMFRPFIGEIITGKVQALDTNGLRRIPVWQRLLLKVSLGFFSDILVPADLLPTTSTFDDGCWTWRYQDDDSEPVELPIEKDDEIRFRVHHIKYPTVPLEREKEGKDAEPFAPMVITASIDADGLDPISWWV